MIKVTLEIDNKTAHSCSPLEFLRKFILLDAKTVIMDDKTWCAEEEFDTPYAKINVIEIEQI